GCDRPRVDRARTAPGRRALARRAAPGHGQALRALGQGALRRRRGQGGPGSHAQRVPGFLLLSAMAEQALHTTVLLDEAVDALLAEAPKRSDGLWVDATFGRGGHSRRILSRIPPGARVLAFDKDPEAIQAATRIEDARFSIRHAGFANL